MKVENIDAVLYDFGGVFTLSPFEEVENWGRQIGVPPGEKLLEIIFGPYHEDTDHPWHRVERGEVSLLEARDAIIRIGAEKGIDSDLFKIFARMSHAEGARQDVLERALAIARCGYATALITNNAEEFRERWMAMIPTNDLFDVIIDSSEVGIRKPDPRIFQMALEKLGGVSPERSLFLDDLETNVVAARRLGIHGVVVENDPAETLDVLDRLIEIRHGSTAPFSG